MKRRLQITLAMLAFSCVVFVSGAMASQQVDVRILIDVSGSMKANDPRNLRIPAVRLVAELMPQGAVAGIWAFSERIERLLPPSKVDATWKRRAQQAARGIHSRGLYTDIESVLKAATVDWESSDATDTARHVILLTDGMVDVSKEAAASAASRRRILNNELARIKAYGAQVHTIALSGNSDRELMTELAESTEAWAEQVDDAASLQRVFLHMFEQAAAPDSLPLLDNRFEVDGSINEMTLLVFRRDAAQTLQLIDPDGSLMDKRAHEGNINWRSENGYDLITVAAPATGVWQINTPPDPDNRVLIVTDLRLEVESLPTNVLTDESLAVRAHISERGELLERKDFLALLRAELSVSGPGLAEPLVVPVPLDEAQSSFIGEQIVDWPAGDYELVVRVDGGTFQREQRAKLRIHGAPITFANRLATDGLGIEFDASADAGLVDIDSLTGLVIVEKPGGGSEVFDLPPFSDGGKSSLVMAVSENGTYRIAPWVFGTSASGRVLSIKAPPMLSEVSAVPQPPAVVEPEVVEAEPVAAINWLHTGSIVLAGNAVVGILLGALWFWLGRRRVIPANEVVLQ